MNAFFETWNKAATTTAGLFWTAFWAFGFGYLISSMIQVFVTEKRMQQTMGTSGPRSVGLATVFGFLSSSCSFAALSTTRAIFAKGAGLVPALAFLLASTNLVVELGIVIAIFLGWQFVVGEYLGGVLLILCTWLLVRLFRPQGIIEQARKQAREEQGEDEEGSPPDWKQLIRRREGWKQVAKTYTMEWDMVWKDVTIGFTVAGIIATFVPKAFFQTLFIGSGGEQAPGFGEVLAQAVIGPVAAFFTFIGSMGNIPLAAVLYGNGVAFAGVMAFIFSDLVVLPVLRIQAQYYGWKMAGYILGLFLVSLVVVAVLMHYGFQWAGLLPDASNVKSVSEREFVKLDYTFALNLIFIVLSLFFYGWKVRQSGAGGMGASTLTEKILRVLAVLSFLWLGGGLAAGLWLR